MWPAESFPQGKHNLDAEIRATIENEIGTTLRAVEIIFRSHRVNRPLSASEKREENLSKTLYCDQVNKVANANKEIIIAIKSSVTKDRLLKEHDVLVSQPKRNKKSNKALLVGAGLTILSIFIYWKLSTSKPASPAPSPTISKSLVVLPFEDLSPNKDQGWFTDGLTEELLNGLSTVSELRLISRTTAFSNRYFSG